MSEITKIFGAPGTGKTTKLLDILEQEVVSGTPVNRIAYVSHTVAARDEARERVMKRVKAESKDFHLFRTIHGICYRVLGLSAQHVMQPDNYLQFGEHIGWQFSKSYTDDLDEDGLPIGYNLSMGNEIMATRQYAAAHMKLVSEVKDHWPNWISYDQMREAITEYADWKNKNGMFDYVDMLEMYYNGRTDPLNIDAIFIDEAQDLSLLQWEVVHKMWGRAKRIYIAGDDDQSIYEFIGADAFGFLDHPCDRNIVLPVTHRCSSNIWGQAQSIIRQVKRRKDKDVTVKKEGGTIEYWNRDVPFLPFEGNMLILARHNNQLNQIARELKSLGISYAHRGNALTGTDRAQSLHAYFRLAEGEPVSLPVASRILAMTTMRDALKHLRIEAREHPDWTIDRVQMEKEFGFKFDDWVNNLARNKSDIILNEHLKAIINENGLDTLLERPKITLTTYHNSKGREADHVMLFTDMYKSAWVHERVSADNEKRIAYVGLTRARDRVTIVGPKTSMYMRTLV